MEALSSLSCVLALGCNLIAFFISTLTSITGPAMALRGPEGSYPVALRHMEQNSQRAMLYFGRGLMLCCLNVVCEGLEQLSDLALIRGMAIIAAAAWTIGRLIFHGADIGASFHVSVNSAVRAEFESRPSPPPAAKGVCAPARRMTIAQREELSTHEMDLQQRVERRLAQDRLSSAGGTRDDDWLQSGLALLTGLCGCRPAWRPPGHSSWTPLWRLDKLIVLPYHSHRSRQSLYRTAPRSHDHLSSLGTCAGGSPINPGHGAGAGTGDGRGPAAGGRSGGGGRSSGPPSPSPLYDDDDDGGAAAYIVQRAPAEGSELSSQDMRREEEASRGRQQLRGLLYGAQHGARGSAYSGGEARTGAGGRAANDGGALCASSYWAAGDS